MCYHLKTMENTKKKQKRENNQKNGKTLKIVIEVWYDGTKKADR